MQPLHESKPSAHEFGDSRLSREVTSSPVFLVFMFGLEKGGEGRGEREGKVRGRGRGGRAQKRHSSQDLRTKANGFRRLTPTASGSVRGAASLPGTLVVRRSSFSRGAGPLSLRRAWLLLPLCRGVLVPGRVLGSLLPLLRLFCGRRFALLHRESTPSIPRRRPVVFRRRGRGLGCRFWFVLL